MLAIDVSLALEEGESSVRKIATKLAEDVMADPDLLKAELQGEGPLGRRDFCRFMGIGESTLTGWLQADRIPQTAAVAYVLLLMSQVLRADCRALEDRGGEPRVIALGGRYAVVRFETGETEQELGQVIASDIPDLLSARRIAFSQSKHLTKLVDRHLELIDDQIAFTEDCGNDPAVWEDERAKIKDLRRRFSLQAEEETPQSKA